MLARRERPNLDALKHRQSNYVAGYRKFFKAADLSVFI